VTQYATGTAILSAVNDQIGEAIDGGSVWLARIIQSGVATHTPFRRPDAGRTHHRLPAVATGPRRIAAAFPFVPLVPFCPERTLPIGTARPGAPADVYWELPMTPAQVGFFSSARVTEIMQGLTDPRLLPIPLTWNARVPDVPAVDEEVTAKYVGTLLIADLIADDAKAVTYSQGRFQFQTTQVPNIKMGLALNQAMINALQRIRDMGGANRDDVGFFADRWAKNVQDVKFGVELRKEVLKLGMLLDGIDYDRLGIKMSGVTFGMYSDLKVTPSASPGRARAARRSRTSTACGASRSSGTGST
jgi:hypothetical protein